MQHTDTSGDGLFALPPPSAFLANCPKFRLLVLGNVESTKIEIFSKVLGVELDKSSVAAAFGGTHHVASELDTGTNSRLALHTSANFANGDRASFEAAVDFLKTRQQSADVADRVHCIWYCVSCDTDREIDGLEADFFRRLPSVAPATPTLLVFTKYEELIIRVREDWFRDKPSGLSNQATSHILQDMTTKEFENSIGRKWAAAVGNGHVPQICVATEDEGRADMERLAAGTLAELKGKAEKLAFVAAQKASPPLSTQVCTDIAAEYFTTDTGHARKKSGVDGGEILRDYLHKCIRVFNLTDPHKVLLGPSLLEEIMAAMFDAEKLGFIKSLLAVSGPSLMDSLSPHDRACLLTQALTGVVWFFHRLSESQWLHRDPVPELTARSVARELAGIRAGSDRKAVLETVEASPIFSTCRLTTQVSDLVLKAVQQVHKWGLQNDAFVVEDESELQEISMSFVNDQARNDVVLPNGMTVLALN